MIEAAKAHLAQDPHIGPLIQAIELPHRQPSNAVYYDLLESIVSQQLSVKAATTIFNRFLELFEDRYPHPPQVLACTTEQLRAVGLSNQKAGYLKNVAQYAHDHQWHERDWHRYSDEELLAHLTQIKGVGRWTVQMVLMFTLHRPDIFPVDDLGIQQGMAKLFKLEEQGKALKQKMEALAASWQPYRTVACWYVWRYKDAMPFVQTPT